VRALRCVTLPSHDRCPTMPCPSYPPNLTWRRVMSRQITFNQAFIVVGVFATHAMELASPRDPLAHSFLYDMVWLELIGLFGLLITGHGIWLALQHGWRHMPNASAHHDQEGLFNKNLPASTRWLLLLVAVAGPLTSAHLAQQAFIAVQGTNWGMANLEPIPPSYSATLFSMAYGVVASYVFEYLHDRWTLHEARERMAKKLTTEAQLQLLRSQLDPHMLFNTLSNLYALIDESPQQARAMLLNLIGFLRSTLNGSLTTQHALGEEFKLASDYLSLMQIRMGERLRARLDLPDVLRAVPVPSMLLQPLIENAIKHGLEPLKEGGELSVTASLEAGQLVLRVSNSGMRETHRAESHWARQGDGFGLRSVQDRLTMLYGPGEHIEFNHLHEPDLTQVTLRLPLVVQGGSA